MTKLIEGHQYNFKVMAENEIGESDPCVSSEPIKARLPFGECLSSAWSFLEKQFLMQRDLRAKERFMSFSQHTPEH